MNHENAVALIKNGVDAPGGTWADFGSGAGTFTHALSELLGSAGRVIAVDRDGPALRLIGLVPTSDAPIRTLQASFTKPLELADLDGLLFANSLHFVRQQKQVLRRLVGYLKSGGRVFFMEYDSDRAVAIEPVSLGPRTASAPCHGDGIGCREMKRRPPSFRVAP